MTVSKRLRFEILRRDNHTCRYCGASAPEVKLNIDHVVPTALGGTDDPSNLVCACEKCNGGKSSSSPDAAVVADVSQAAVAWSAAMKQAAEENKLNDNTTVYEAVVNAWTSYRRKRDIPGDYRETIDQFLNAGLPAADVVAMSRVADAKPDVFDRWSYFCGCCWNRLRQIQERAAELMHGDAVVVPELLPTADDSLSTRVTRAEIKNSLRWVTARLVRDFGASEEEVIDDLSGYSCIHNDNLAECGDLVCTYICLAECFMSWHATDFAHQDAAEHPPTSRGWFKSVWYDTSWRLGHRAWKNIHADSLDQIKAEAVAEGLTPNDPGFVDEDGKLYTTDAPRPLGFFDDVDHFLGKGLRRSQIERNVIEAMSAPIDVVDLWSYFRGCCRRDLVSVGEAND
jgi:hypothetical protein